MSAVRRTLAVVAAVMVAGSVSGPAVAAKPKPAHTAKRGVCAVKSGSLRPSPVRVCRKVLKAPRALPR